MSEDKVVRPDFTRNRNSQRESRTILQAEPIPMASVLNARKIAEEGVLGPFTKEDLALAKQDIGYILANLDFINSIRNRIEKMNDFIFSLQGFDVKDRNVTLRRETLRKHSLQDICIQVQMSDELQWKGQPSYFGAVTLEYQARVNRAMKLLPDSTPDGAA